MKIAIANDHAATEYKKLLVEYLKGKGFEVINFGTDDNNSCDYPDYAKKVAKAVTSKQADFGVLICGSGVGMSICANRFKGIRASLCDNVLTARLTRSHNDSNVLCMGARIIGVEMMYAIADAYFATPFDEGENRVKHERRIAKLDEE